MKKIAALIGFAFATQVFGQAAFPPPPPKVSPAAGVIDMHTHTHPDVFGRSIDDVDLATLAKARGMRGIVIKNHISETASRAALAMKAVPGIEVWGGIVLNNAVGGINPVAVEWMHRFYGSRGKVVGCPRSNPTSTSRPSASRPTRASRSPLTARCCRRWRKY